MPSSRLPRVLLLGGTAEARSLARALVDAGIDVVSSLAGRVGNPRLPVGEVRVGGFGGVAGLVTAIREGGFTHVVDATHPFAATMREHAVAAGAEAGVPVLRLARPGWGGRPDAETWHWVADLDAARDTAEKVGSRSFVSSGRQTLPHFISWHDRPVLVRVVEPLDEPAPAAWTVVLDRGPYRLEGERALLRDNGIDVIVTKDSGGAYTSAKLDAAAELGIAVVVVARPASPTGLDEVGSVAECVEWLGGLTPPAR